RPAGKRRQAKKHKRNAPGKPPGAPGASPEAVKAARAAKAARLAKSFDVELVPVPGPAANDPAVPARLAPPPRPGGSSLQLRDLILLGVGGGSFLLAIVVGWLLANWSGLLLTGQDLMMFGLGAASVLLLAPLAYAGCRWGPALWAKRPASTPKKAA